MVMDHLEHIDGANGQYLHAGQGGFPSNEAYHHNLMYAPSGGYQYLGPPFTTAPTLSPQQQQAVLFAHNSGSNPQQPQQSSQQQHAQLQHQQHGQAQAQQVQSTPSPGQPNGSIGAFHSFTPSDQLGNEFAYFQSQR